MATYSVDETGWDGDTHRRVRVTATMSSGYTQGGETLTAADVGLDSVTSVTVLHGVTPGGYVPRYDPDAAAILLFEAGADGAPLDEVAAGTDLSSETVALEVRGRS